jgi:hypothetical protein
MSSSFGSACGIIVADPSAQAVFAVGAWRIAEAIIIGEPAHSYAGTEGRYQGCICQEERQHEPADLSATFAHGRVTAIARECTASGGVSRFDVT